MQQRDAVVAFLAAGRWHRPRCSGLAADADEAARVEAARSQRRASRASLHRSGCSMDSFRLPLLSRKKMFDACPISLRYRCRTAGVDSMNIVYSTGVGRICPAVAAPRPSAPARPPRLARRGRMPARWRQPSDTRSCRQSGDVDHRPAAGCHAAGDAGTRAQAPVRQRRHAQAWRD